MRTVVTLIAVEIYEFHDAEDGQTYLWNATEGRRLAEAIGCEFVPIRLADVGMTPQKVLQMAPDLDTKKALGLPARRCSPPSCSCPTRASTS